MERRRRGPELDVELMLDSEEASGLLLGELWDADSWDDRTYLALDQLRPFATAPRTERGLIKFERATMVAGDLVVDGDLELLSHTLVLGNLRCTGYVYSGIHCDLLVAGDVSVRGIDALRSYWLIGGSIQAETAWLSTYGFLRQRGVLRARLLVVEQYFELENDTGIEAAARIDTDYLGDDDTARARLGELIDVEAMANTKGEFDRWELLRRVARGAPVFRGG